MKIISIIFVAFCHAMLFLSLVGVEGELLMADFSSEGLTEMQEDGSNFPKYPHQSKEYVIAVVDSDWIFPNYVEPPKAKEPEIKDEPIITPTEIIPATPPTPPEKVEASAKPEPKPTKKPVQAPKKTQQPTANKTQKGTGAGQRNAVGKGSGNNLTDGPAGFSNGNSQQTLLNNIQRCYPLISRKRGEQGVAVVRIHVDANGHATRTELIQSTKFSRLDNCALESVKSLKVKPKVVNGKNTSSHFDQTIRFRLN